jgi:hypothetical protein
MAAVAAVIAVPIIVIVWPIVSSIILFWKNNLLFEHKFDVIFVGCALNI